VQETHFIDQWGYTPMEWLKNRVIKKYQDMKTRGIYDRNRQQNQIEGRMNGKIDAKRTS
jgi:hypothetical protein